MHINPSTAAQLVAKVVHINTIMIDLNWQYMYMTEMLVPADLLQNYFILFIKDILRIP